ncbi:hypothetical protein [Fervidibacillus albus]|uniref:Uncharacterized protein n=1 Tax=Fervidibacillus albus TaxID=2980026 RepID=A0A9E8LS57_9BACI|nr:hypothetical protein [Fervidibacillus albus]WAA08593.1 hypothetical protein OE104_08025 [Fervidibacillus albus]
MMETAKADLSVTVLFFLIRNNFFEKGIGKTVAIVNKKMGIFRLSFVHAIY